MNNIITISRSFSSGGREVAKRLAEELGYAYYDKQLMQAIAEETGFSQDYIEEYSETPIVPVYPINIAQSFIISHQTPSDSLQIAQSNIIKKAANAGNCVIVGRRADYILRDLNPLKVFIYSSDISKRIQRCYDKVPADRVKSPKELQKEILSVDKKRAKYYSYYTDLTWSDMKNYNLCIDTSVISIKKAVEIIMAALSQ